MFAMLGLRAADPLAVVFVRSVFHSQFLLKTSGTIAHFGDCRLSGDMHRLGCNRLELINAAALKHETIKPHFLQRLESFVAPSLIMSKRESACLIVIGNGAGMIWSRVVRIEIAKATKFVDAITIGFDARQPFGARYFDHARTQELGTFRFG
jgi:hypothetical protein